MIRIKFKTKKPRHSLPAQSDPYGDHPHHLPHLPPPVYASWGEGAQSSQRSRECEIWVRARWVGDVSLARREVTVALVGHSRLVITHQESAPAHDEKTRALRRSGYKTRDVGAGEHRAMLPWPDYPSAAGALCARILHSTVHVGRPPPHVGSGGLNRCGGGGACW